jgi:hypothetical protein
VRAERFLVHPQQGSQVLIERRFGGHHPAVTEGERETRLTMARAIDSSVPKYPESRMSRTFPSQIRKRSKAIPHSAW